MLDNAKMISFAATKNAAAAKQFYEQTLGLTLIADEPPAIVFDANGTNLRLQKVQDFQPHPFTTLGWQVADIEVTVKGLIQKGVQFEKFPDIPQDDLNITSFASGAKVVWFKDPDGNLLSLTQW